MINEELKNIVAKARQKNLLNLYIKSLLKEYLQVYVLNFIYLNPDYNKKLIFTGGTCLRHCYDLNRLSEDLDFDMEEIIEAEKLKLDLEKYFKIDYLYDEVVISVHQQGRQLLLKFPVLKNLALASESESDWLYVKIDLSQIQTNEYGITSSLKSVYGFNYMVNHYDLPSLMAGKMAAILTRSRLVGKENFAIIKGRDYFDLLWYLDNKVNFNLKRLNALLKKIYTINGIMELIDEKVAIAMSNNQRQYFKKDLMSFIDDTKILDSYVENFSQNYEEKKRYLISFPSS